MTHPSMLSSSLLSMSLTPSSVPLFIFALYVTYPFLCTIIQQLTYPCSIYTYPPLLPLHVRTTLSCPYRRPAGVLALSLGGITHAALLTNLFDAVGFLAASVLSYYAMELGTVRYSTYATARTLQHVQCSTLLFFFGIFVTLSSTTLY
jgi:hypothetical protein